MKKVIILAAVVLTSVQAFSKVTELKSEKRISGDFHFISIEGEMDVILAQGQAHSIDLKGTEEQISAAITMLKNDTLFLYTTNEKVFKTRLAMKVDVENLKGVLVNGNSTVGSENSIQTDGLSIKSEGGGKVNIDLSNANASQSKEMPGKKISN